MSRSIENGLFIPHMFTNFSQKYVAEAFENVGVVDRVDFVAKQGRDGKPYNSVYIHFKKIYDNAIVERIQDEIYDNGSYHMYHDDSAYYWIVLPNNNTKKFVPGERKQRINLTSEKVVEKPKPKQVVEKPATKPIVPAKTSYASVLGKDNHVSVKDDKKDVSVKEAVKDDHVSVKDAEEEFDIDLSEEDAQMAEIAEELAAEDDTLVSIDWRYVDALEKDNVWLHAEVAQLRAALVNLETMYQAEKAKACAFNV